MISRLYECHIMHARLHPRSHRFGYNLFMLALDLDELPALGSRLRLLSINAPGFLSFRERDYLPTHHPAHNVSPSAPSSPVPATAPASLKTRVLAYLAAHGIAAADDARVLLITLPRVLGYQFNPVSFYFISRADGTPLASIAEVTNTFRETKPFVLGSACLAPTPASAAAPCFHLRAPKNFYVSPFSDVDVAFDFRLRPPGERLALQIDDYVGPLRTLLTTVSGRPRPLRDRTLAWFAIKYPLVTLQVIAAIHWQALRLYLKNVPWFSKAARPADQRDLYHPHASLTSAPRP